MTPHYSNEPYILRVLAFSLLTFILISATGLFTRLSSGTILWLLIYAGSAVYIFSDIKGVLQAIGNSWPVLILPLFALLSTFWSEVPERSIYASIQFTVTTVIAIWIATKFSLSTFFTSLLIATGLGVMLSILNDFIHFLPQNITADVTEHANSGMYNQKNVYGKVICLFTLTILITGFRIKKPVIALLICLLLIKPLLSTRSSGALIIYLITMTFPLIWIMTNLVKNQFLLIQTLWVGVLVGLFITLTLDLNIVDTLLGGLGKDSTLTGRTWLWSIGFSIFDQFPLTGVGYQAFWQSDSFPEVRLIHTYFHGQPLNGFHNSYIEVLVALGVIGLLAFIFLLVYVLFNNFRFFLRARSADSLGALLFVILAIIQTFTETILFKQHESSYILLITFLAFSRQHAVRNIINK